MSIAFTHTAPKKFGIFRHLSCGKGFPSGEAPPIGEGANRQNASTLSGEEPFLTLPPSVREVSHKCDGRRGLIKTNKTLAFCQKRTSSLLIISLIKPAEGGVKLSPSVKQVPLSPFPRKRAPRRLLRGGTSRSRSARDFPNCATRFRGGALRHAKFPKTSYKVQLLDTRLHGRCVNPDHSRGRGLIFLSSKVLVPFKQNASVLSGEGHPHTPFFVIPSLPRNLLERHSQTHQTRASLLITANKKSPRNEGFLRFRYLETFILQITLCAPIENSSFGTPTKSFPKMSKIFPDKPNSGSLPVILPSSTR